MPHTTESLAAIAKITVVGGGVMGRGIGLAAGLAGFRVALFDREEQALAGAREFVERELLKAVARGKLSSEEADDVLARLAFEASLDAAVEEVDLVIEAVPEILDLKTQVLAELDALCPPHVIFATNTSTISPSAIAAGTKRADRVLAMHFFNPAHKMKLVEIIRGLDTSQDTVDRAKDVCIRMGKEPVEVNEAPGFVAGRVSCVLGNEAMHMLTEGVASAEAIDRAVRLGLGHPMGPLELADLVGLDSRLRNLEYLHTTLGERFRPPPILRTYVGAGRLGRKSGHGFYRYDEDGDIVRGDAG